MPLASRSRTGRLALAVPIKTSILPLAHHAFFIKGQGHTIPVLWSPCHPLAHFSATKPGTACWYPVFPHDVILMFSDPSVPCLHSRFKYLLGASHHKDTNHRQNPFYGIHSDNLTRLIRHTLPNLHERTELLQDFAYSFLLVGFPSARSVSWQRSGAHVFTSLPIDKALGFIKCEHVVSTEHPAFGETVTPH
jgi:hypothetical protein